MVCVVVRAGFAVAGRESAFSGGPRNRTSGTNRTQGNSSRPSLVELDKIFWQPRLESMARVEWVKKQQALVAQESWIINGDLGPYDAVEVRFSAAETIILLDFGLVRCAWRALRRRRERSDFWQWLITYRRRSLPALVHAISKFAPHASFI